jgi:protein phosphatase
VGSPTPVEPHLEDLPLEGTGTLLLCSDGLHDLVDGERIVAALAEQPALAVSTLVGLALDAGGRDNVTVAVVGYSRDGSRG